MMTRFGMGFVWLWMLMLVVRAGLIIAALIKYLRSQPSLPDALTKQ